MKKTTALVSLLTILTLTFSHSLAQERRRQASGTPEETFKRLDRNGDGELTPDELADLTETARAQVAETHGEIVHKTKRPWLGWVPVNPAHKETARPIIRAYRKLLKRLNPDPPEGEPVPDAIWPEDGMYEIRNGDMQRVG